MTPHAPTASEAAATVAPARTLPGGLRRDLERLLGPAGFIRQADRLLAYESDALTRVRGVPLAVALPATRDQLRATVRKLYETGIPFVPRGAGTGLTGGAVARDAVIVATTRLDRFLRLDPDERLATVEPGVITDEISRRAAPHGLRYLPDPGSASACTIGGNVAANAGGPHCLKHGVTSDHVLGLEAVLPDGRRVELDRGESGGLDLAGLFVGSEGTFGFVTAITVRLVPDAPAVRTSLALFDRIADSGRAVTEILATGIVPVALEIIDRTTIRVVEESPFAAGWPTDVGAALVIECEGTAQEAEEAMSAALKAVRGVGARQVLTASSQTERDRLWQARKKAFGALGRLGPDVLIEDAVVPRTTLPDLLPRIEAVAERLGLPLANFFHAGDGNLHPNFVFDVTDAEQTRRVEAAREEVLELCVGAGGTITGEHGVGLDKLDAMPRIFGPAELDTLRALKQAFDPAALCNPGKAVPRASEFEGPPRMSRPAAAPRDPASAVASAVAGDGGATAAEGGARAAADRGGPTWHAPESARETAGLLAAIARGARVFFTGAAPPPDVGVELRSDAGVELSEEGVGLPSDAGVELPEEAVIFSTAGMRGIVAHQRDDLTVTVRAGERVSDLLATLAAAGQWIPVEGRAAGLSVGGLVASAPPGAFDAAFGPLRRQVLALQVVSPEGVIQRWGRAVMKNVAGYDLPRLHCGGFGRLGVITEVTFRLWPLLASSVRLVAVGPVRRLVQELRDARAAARPDGARWTLEMGAEDGPQQRLTLWLIGAERSVRTRTDGLTELAASCGCELRELPGARDGTHAERQAGPGKGPHTSALRIAASRGGFLEATERVAELLRGRRARLDGLPGTGVLRLEHVRPAKEASGVLERILEARDGCDVAVERGGPEEHELARQRRPPSLRELEDVVIAAAAGDRRRWQADYV